MAADPKDIPRNVSIDDVRHKRFTPKTEQAFLPTTRVGLGQDERNDFVYLNPVWFQNFLRTGGQSYFGKNILLPKRALPGVEHKDDTCHIRVFDCRLQHQVEKPLWLEHNQTNVKPEHI